MMIAGWYLGAGMESTVMGLRPHGGLAVCPSWGAGMRVEGRRCAMGSAGCSQEWPAQVRKQKILKIWSVSKFRNAHYCYYSCWWFMWSVTCPFNSPPLSWHSNQMHHKLLICSWHWCKHFCWSPFQWSTWKCVWRQEGLHLVSYDIYNNFKL